MNIGNKRKDATGDLNAPKRVKKACDYGERCYRRNPAHFREFSHKHLETILDQYSGTGDYPIPEKYVMERLSIMEQLDIIVEKALYTPWKDKPVSTQQATTSNSTSAHSQQNLNRHTGSGNSEVISRNAEMISNAGTSSRNDGLSSGDLEMSSLNAVSGNNASKPSGYNNNDSENFDYRKAPDYIPIVLPTRRVEDFLSVVRPKGQMAAKHAATAPYHVFYTTITAASETHAQPNSITFLEILDSSLGELKCSLQINFMVELGWLMAQYYFAGYSNKKLTIIYGEESEDLKTIKLKRPSVETFKVVMPTKFGTHHTKMMILWYEDGSLRIVISTANLYLDDWENRTQGLWFSPACRPLPPGSAPHDGESPTFFKRSLLQYLNQYEFPGIKDYIELVIRCDFSHINVFLIASVPGPSRTADWGLWRLGDVLRQHCTGSAARWPLLAQASSLGSFGPQPSKWLTGDFLKNFTKVIIIPKVLSAPPELKLIYPSLENVRQSHDGLLGGGCLPYGALTHTKQPWLNDFLYQWRAVSSGRNRAMPHVKSYIRVSPDCASAAYYLLTSANTSKAAWGSVNKAGDQLSILSYEVGVLFLPQFVINREFFPLNGDVKLPLVYDLPPTKYEAHMSPWVMDYLHT